MLKDRAWVEQGFRVDVENEMMIATWLVMSFGRVHGRFGPTFKRALKLEKQSIWMTRQAVKKKSPDCGPPTHFNDNTPGPQVAPTMCSGGNRVGAIA